MYRKVFSMALLCIATTMLVIPQLGNTAESLKKTTDNKRFEVVITPPGDGFTVGTNDLALKISDSEGKGVTGAIISITPWMPGMGHGVMLKPSVKETGSGYYSAGNVGFSMPGQWQLIVTVNKKDLQDKATFEFASIGGGTVANTEVVCNCGTGGNCPSSCLCGCQAGKKGASCNMKDGKCQGNCSCGCKEGKPCNMKDGKCIGGCGCGCQAGAVAAKCNMVDGKCQGNCSCGCKEGKPCNMKDGKCVGGCGCGCQIGTATSCSCGTGGNCPAGCLCGCQAGKTGALCNMKDGKCQGDCSCGCKEGKPCNMKDGKCVGGCGCGCQSAGISNCKCGSGCTNLINCSCGPNCSCPKDGKGGCGCKVVCATGCAKGGACPLPRPLGT